MKIGLISINSHTRTLNFGSMIHSYAFQQFLLKNGIESTIIEYKPVYFGKIDVRNPLGYYKERPHPDPEKQAKIIEKWENLSEVWAGRYDKLMKFQDTYYIKTDKCYTPSRLDKEDPGFDCYICATDVLWKYHKKSGFDKGYFLASNSMKGKKKIAYAASRGATQYTLEQKIQFLNYISDFDYISTREKSLKDYIHKTADLDVPQVLDPVFLMPREFYANLAKKPDVLPQKKFVLVYLAMENNPDFIRAIAEFSRRNDYEMIELSVELKNENLVPDYPHKVLCNVGVEEWLWYIQHAEYIFTNSFHGSCFSIIFEKRFFAGQRGGDKIDFLLELFGLEERKLQSFKEVVYADKLPDIDYAALAEKKNQEIKASGDFILSAIHDLERREHRPLVADPAPLIERAKLEQEKKKAKKAKKAKRPIKKLTKKEQRRNKLLRIPRKIKRKIKDMLG